MVGGVDPLIVVQLDKAKSSVVNDELPVCEEFLGLAFLGLRDKPRVQWEVFVNMWIMLKNASIATLHRDLVFPFILRCEGINGPCGHKAIARTKAILKDDSLHTVSKFTTRLNC